MCHTLTVRIKENFAPEPIALDGKTLRRSFDNFNDRKAAQLLHAFDVEAGLVLAHVDIEEKSNEIPAAQQLLGELQVAHCIVTLDAMHCQKKTFEAAARAQARLIVQLKDNQPTLLQNVQAACASRRPASSDTTVTSGHGRQETRTADVFSASRAMRLSAAFRHGRNFLLGIRRSRPPGHMSRPGAQSTSATQVAPVGSARPASLLREVPGTSRRYRCYAVDDRPWAAASGRGLCLLRWSPW